METMEAPHGFQSNDMAENLYALGWTKVFLDSRALISFPAIQNPFGKSYFDFPSSDAALPSKLT
jgi:hypothetical protein